VTAKMVGAGEVVFAEVVAFKMIDGMQVDVTVRVPFDMVRGLAIGGVLKVGRACEECHGTGNIPSSDPQHMGFRHCECRKDVTP
jgi:hypothetical protein